MSSYEQIIKAIVEGQIKNFIDGHPGLLDCVVWFRPRKDLEGKKQTFVNSVSKRLIQDLTSEETKQRIRIALADGLLLEQEGAAPTPIPGRVAPGERGSGVPIPPDSHIAYDQLPYSIPPYSWEYVRSRPFMKYRIRDSRDNAVGHAETQQAAELIIDHLNKK